MKNTLIIACCMAAVAICGCVHNNAVEDVWDAGPGGRLFQHHACEHVRLKSVLGLSDAVLADTNRFLAGSARYSHRITLDKPFLGCREATVYFDEMMALRSTAGSANPHRLRSVELKHALPEQITSAGLLREGNKVVGEIAELLDVEPPDVELSDIGAWRRFTDRMEVIRGVETTVFFDLADGQNIAVRLIEPLYAIRDGVPMLVKQPCIEVDIAFNDKLCGSECMRHLRGKECDSVKVEKELDIGDDCSDKLERELKNGVLRRRQPKARQDGEKKSASPTTR